MEHGLPPVYGADCQILILGSFPSKKSRGNFYYAHPQNRFWKTLGRVLGDVPPPDIEGRARYLLSHRIALWDVVADCEIVGSADNDIHIADRSQINDIDGLLSKISAVQIFCNGKTSYRLFQKYFPHLTAVCLPSTSPANVRFDEPAWRRIASAFFS